MGYHLTRFKNIEERDEDGTWAIIPNTWSVRYLLANGEERALIMSNEDIRLTGSTIPARVWLR